MLVLTAVVMMFIAGVNIVIDPYRVLNTTTLPGVNEYKVSFFFHQLLAKPYAVGLKKPNAIVLGSSRAGSAIDAEHPGWDGLNGYNLALGGIDPYMMWRSFQHANANNKLRRVLLTLDFYMFNVHHLPWPAPAGEEYEERLSVTASNGRNYYYPLRWFKDMSALLLSYDTLSDSWKTLHAQAGIEDQSKPVTTLYESGLWASAVPPNMQQRNVFKNIENQYMTTMWFPGPSHRFEMSDASQSSRLKYIEKILAECYRENIEVTLVFMPFHARLGEAMHAVNLWKLFELWKKDVLVLNEHEALENGRQAYPVWDFTGYNSVTMEAVPPPGDRDSRMRWHADSSHISKAAGDLMQDRIWGSSTSMAPDFGRLVTSDNIDAFIREDRAARSRYVAGFKLDVREVGVIAKRTRSQRSDGDSPEPLTQ
jgi:hypothetical protein